MLTELSTGCRCRFTRPHASDKATEADRNGHSERYRMPIPLRNGHSPGRGRQGKAKVRTMTYSQEVATVFHLQARQAGGQLVPTETWPAAGAGSWWLQRMRQRSNRFITALYVRISQAMDSAASALRARMGVVLARPESGAITAEYAVIMVAAATLAGVLLAIVKSSSTRTLLMGLVKKALSAVG